jgi:serine protease DegQ
MSTTRFRRRIFEASVVVLGLAAVIAVSSRTKSAIAQGSAAITPPPATLGAVIPGTPTLAPLVKAVSPAVVSITVDGRQAVAENPFAQDPFFRRFFNSPDQPMDREFHGAGSGVIIDPSKGYVVTNNHVIENADKISVVLADDRRFDAKVVGTDPEADIAVLQIPSHGLTGIPIGNSDALQPGDFVVALGQPFGLRHTVTSGIVSAVGRSGLNIEGYEDFIQTDASINPGNSGGALVNLQGELIGINTAIVGPTGGNVGIGFAIPINMVRAISDQLIAHGKVVRGQLGIYVQDVTPDIADRLGLHASGGAVVSRVEAGSAAEHAGIRAGDVITAVDGTSIHDGAELRNAIGLKQPGDVLKIDLVRDRKAQTITARLETRRENSIDGNSVDTRLQGVELTPAASTNDSPAGMLVTKIERNSPAYESGLRSGDIITAVNREAVSSLDDLRAAVRNDDGALLLDVQRGESALFLVIR